MELVRRKRDNDGRGGNNCRARQSRGPREPEVRFTRQTITARWKSLGLASLGLLVAIQFIRPSTVNPAIQPEREIAAVLRVDPGIQSIFRRSCDDCHSNRTVWPWYSHVAPVSWLVASDVYDGRRRMNFSEWGTYAAKKRSNLLGNICKKVQAGDMPPLQYLPMHPISRLTQADEQQLCQWIANAK